MVVEVYVKFVAGDLNISKAQGGLAMQSLHVLPETCVPSLLHPLLHALHKYHLAMEPVKFVITC